MTNIAVDANLLLLLVIGTASTELIGKHKRLREYGIDDYRLLIDAIGRKSIAATPNVLTEVSNLAVYGLKEPLRSNVLGILGLLIENMPEQYRPSREVARQPEFRRLGLADAAWLCVLAPRDRFVTADLQLYLAALERGIDALNFNHLRSAAGIL
jgi:hypothetical protein